MVHTTHLFILWLSHSVLSFIAATKNIIFSLTVISYSLCISSQYSFSFLIGSRSVSMVVHSFHSKVTAKNYWHLGPFDFLLQNKSSVVMKPAIHQLPIETMASILFDGFLGERFVLGDDLFTRNCKFNHSLALKWLRNEIWKIK